jgi:hypothetical protein
MIIYKTTNTVNNKFYIGKDVKNNPSYLGSGLLLNKAIEKYGKSAFIKEVIEQCDNPTVLAEREKYWIKKFNATDRKIGYNIAFGGLGGDTFTNNPNKSIIIEKRKISIQRYTNINGHAPMCLDVEKRIEMAKKANAARTIKGYKHSEETKTKIGNAHRGKELSEEVRKKISVTTKKNMSKLNQKELQLKALEGRKKAWEKRDRERINKIKDLIKKDIKSKDMREILKISSPTFYRLLKLAKKN